MFARHNRLIGLIYLFTDFVLALASFGLAHVVRAHLPGTRQFFPISNYPWIVPLILALWIGAGIVAGIYREVQEEDLRRAFVDPLKVGLAATVVLLAVISVVKFEYISRLLLAIFGLIDVLAMICFRLPQRLGPTDLSACGRGAGGG